MNTTVVVAAGAALVAAVQILSLVLLLIAPRAIVAPRRPAAARTPKTSAERRTVLKAWLLAVVKLGCGRPRLNSRGHRVLVLGNWVDVGLRMLIERVVVLVKDAICELGLSLLAFLTPRCDA